MQVRRLLAGEAVAAEVRAHVAACGKCLETQREIEREKEALERDLPFPQFAAGVAEKLALAKKPSLSRWVPLAAAAGLALMAGVLTLRPADTETVRSKGAPSAQVFVKDSSGVHRLAGAVPEKAAIEIVLHPAGRRYAAAVLVDGSESSTLFEGPAPNGPLPAFEWTGRGDARLRLYFGDKLPVEQGRPDVEIPLHR